MVSILGFLLSCRSQSSHSPLSCALLIHAVPATSLIEYLVPTLILYRTSLLHPNGTPSYLLWSKKRKHFVILTLDSLFWVSLGQRVEVPGCTKSQQVVMNFRQVSRIKELELIRLSVMTQRGATHLVHPVTVRICSRSDHLFFTLE